MNNEQNNTMDNLEIKGALVNHGEKAVEPLINCLKETYPNSEIKDILADIREPAVIQVKEEIRNDENSEELIREFLSILENNDSAVPFVLHELRNKLPRPETIHHRIKIFTYKSILNRHSKYTANLIIDYLRHEEREMIKELSTLVYFRESVEDEREILIEIFQELEPEAIDPIINALNENWDPETRELLEDMLKDEDFEDRLQEYLKETDDLMFKCQIAEIICEIGNVPLKDILLLISRDGEDEELPDNPDKLTPKELEQAVCKIYRDKGYYASRTKKTNDKDQGADVILTKLGSKRIAVQVKQSSSKVGNSAVQEVVASMRYYLCNSAMVVTNNYYTSEAVDLAKANDVKLINREELRNLIISHHKLFKKEE
ncbi:restriction endonuclease (plasmid) [Methanohalobium evestigatum Z-7303]|uniref:Restriction endonuclease n=1 Tax=Methanohalobium evestigatum (strain ATCC BAA-1072 / DSM 3721 / NBRC 107634 / OCM 161 / Z-7303) TaxID=644295 RepID=D7EBZ0_METEZ|nr:restriction endonuclease [Methanohalobium evestigatum]ADI75112.1 restriction endonuclease [Methanohalobium evestigatum Z-7303]